MLSSATPLHAQVDAGAILGTVSDASGAVVKGATVTLTNEGTAATLSTTTGDDGGYKFAPVKIGGYTVSVTIQGFTSSEHKNLTVNVGASVVANFSLKPGQVTETIEVTTDAPVLQTQDASIGQVVNSRSVNNLPLNGRNFTFLAQLAAGVNTPQADTRGNAATGAFSANGSRPAQNNYLLDGVDNNSDTVDFLNGTNFVILPPVDAVQEFKVQTTDFSAEFGRSGAAVLNATIKSGTNTFHGAGWEFLRNDKLDAADYFENVGGVTKKSKLRLNQFGAAIGGPVIKNKVFFFGDVEFGRRRQGSPHTNGSVPTAQELSSGFTNLQELITGQSGTETDVLCATAAPCDPDPKKAAHRSFQSGTVFDPTTTRAVTAGTMDPVTGLMASASGFVRDPFGGTVGSSCAPSSTPSYTLAACPGLNMIDPLRLDQNAIALLQLYPAPTSTGVSGNFSSSPVLIENRRAFDAKIDLNPNDKNAMFFRASVVDDPQLIPGFFGGVADGGGFQEGTQTALAEQGAFSYTHTFSPTTVNEARAGLSYLHTTRISPKANDLKGAGGNGLPADFGIEGIPQLKENGGLPAFGIQGLQTLGSNAFLPSDEVSSTFQVNDNFTKIYGKHTFKMGVEWQHVKFSTLQPPWSRGQFNFDGVYTNAPGASPSNENTGIAQFLLTPAPANVALGGTQAYVGGPGAQNQGTAAFVSNISLTDNGKNYYGSYFNDDWKVTSKLSVNLGLRWDFFGLVYEHHGNQANFVPGGSPTPSGFSGIYLLPSSASVSNLSTGCLTCFTDLLTKDGIALGTSGAYGKGLGHSQKANFAPRVGFAYQFTPKIVARGGFGWFYNGFENRGFSPNLGENYPFQFNFSFTSPNDGTPITYAGCKSPSATPIGSATLETGFSCTPLDPTIVNASGLALRGIQFNYKTPYTMGGNFTVQYQLTPSVAVQAGYVTNLARHLEVFPNTNNVTQLVGTTQSATDFIPFRDFGRGSSYATTHGNSYYHGLQTKVEKQFSHGLNLLATYTYSRTRTDAGDLLNGGSTAGFRAPDVPGAGIRLDYGLASFDIRNVFHFSGGYDLPFGKGRQFMAKPGKISDALIGGWSVNWSATLQGGQPITLSCPDGTASGTGCYDILVGDPGLGLHKDANGKLNWIGSPSAFREPTVCTVAPCPLSTLGGSPTQISGPGFRGLDFSAFKGFKLTERFRMEFRSEFFNILNHPTFNAPNFGGNGVVAIGGSGNFKDSHFGEIGSTRNPLTDPRQIQFALKLYF
jgi:hypothetical protein